MTDLDTAIADTLQRRAGTTTPTPPPVTVIADRSRRQDRRRALRRSGLVVGCCAIAAGACLAVVSAADRTTDSPPVATQPEISTPGVPDPILEGWPGHWLSKTGDYQDFILGGPERYLIVAYFGGDQVGRLLQPGLQAVVGSDGTPAATPEVRGTTGYVPAGYPMEDLSGPENPTIPPGSTRVVWVERGWTISVTGVQVTSTDELLELVEQLRPFAP